MLTLRRIDNTYGTERKLYRGLYGYLTHGRIIRLKGLKMIHNYRNEIETASRKELIELVEEHTIGIDYHIEPDEDELREYVLDALERENLLYLSAEMTFLTLS